MNYYAVCLLISIVSIVASPVILKASTIEVATTTLSISICGDGLINPGEQCDVPGETGVYSTTIAGRQCTANCQFGPYCGDGILQTLFSEECDDGNNDDADFCSADCKIESAGSGGGGSSGGGSSGGGSTSELNTTRLAVSGTAYPSRTVNIIIDAESAGSVRADTSGDFSFSTEISPGATSVGVWATDIDGTRSITFNTTFDVTQAAITNVRGIMLPPTIKADRIEVNPGDTITFSGQTAPNKEVRLHIDNNALIKETSSGPNGRWSIPFNTSEVTAAAHTAKSRYVHSVGSLTSESSFSSILSFFVGVDGVATSPSDLNRDGNVNLTDFSILIFWWQTAGGNSNPPADINGNGNVGIEDFSILLFNWTG